MQDFLPLNKQLCFAIYETSSEFTKLYSNVLQPFGLTYTQYLVLLTLWEKDGVPVKELGKSLNLGTGTLTPMVNRMEANGWLRKERSKEDERKVYIFLENKALEEKASIIQKVSEEIIACKIDLEEYEALLMRLNMLRNKLRARL
ncbi:MarR family winged helix-turn-helix transcriptional regulator [Bacillus marasmi]|uniref:MarR family winged helix-turn-helix transcriptional regulator n=1 Tax=Bacillus marasmi TaxID=1926279 RepID=UPI0011CAA109|nr:MarR family transcriptional regulator [Bacillus marasmi]